MGSDTPTSINTSDKMFEQLFTEFMKGDDTLRIYNGDRLVFASKKERLLPLMEYLGGPGLQYRNVTIFDKVMGNAAALLSVKAGSREVWSPLGSDLAVKTLDRYNIAHHLKATVPYITQADGQTMCPMEKLSIDKNPDEFYRVLQASIKVNTPADSC
jgi:hypothetical protein